MLFINGFNRISGLSRTGLTFEPQDLMNGSTLVSRLPRRTSWVKVGWEKLRPFKLPIYTISSGQFLYTLCTNNISSNVYALNLFDWIRRVIKFLPISSKIENSCIM